MMVGIMMIAAYLVGALPSGYWLSRFAGINDIRNYGSGNIGATNVARMLGYKYFFIVLFFDAIKAYVFLTVCLLFFEEPVLSLLALALMIGNGYSVFLGGSGGKGMSTMFGIVMALHPGLLFGALVIWLSSLSITRVVGKASVITALLLPLYALAIADMYGFGLIICMSIWVLWRHQNNIRVFYYQGY